MLFVVESEESALPISILNSDNKYSDDLAYVPPQLVRKVRMVHSFREANDSDASLGKTNIVKFKNFTQKQSTSA